MPPVESCPYTMCGDQHVQLSSIHHLLAFGQAWIENIAQTITQQVTYQLNRKNREPRQNSNPGGRSHSLQMRTPQRKGKYTKIGFTCP